MMSSYFYPAPAGGETRHGDDWRTNADDDHRPRQLSLLDWMLQRGEPENWAENEKRN
jgi:hypothetical protein